MVDLYNCAAAYERGKQRIDSWPTHEENKRSINNYLRNCIDHLSPGRRISHLWLIRRIFPGTSQGQNKGRQPLINKPLSALTIEDIDNIRSRVNGEGTSKDTYEKLTNHVRNIYEETFRNDKKKRNILHVLYLTARRRYFKWPSDKPINVSIDQSKYYTADEFLRLLRVANRPKDRALLAVAWEGTARPNEYLTTMVGYVEELPNGFKIRVYVSKQRGGHTRYRFMYIFAFRAEFNEYWRSHGFRDQSDAPLFYQESAERHYGRPLGPAEARDFSYNS